MITGLKVGMCFMLMVSAAALTGQEVAYLDLVNVKPRVELRYPPSPPPVCKEDGSCTASGNSIGISISCGAERGGEPRALKTTLVSLDRFAYAPGDPAEMEIRIDNVGSVDMTIPWNPHLADLQPADEKQGFHYLSLAIILELTSLAHNRQRSIIEVAKLYGVVEKRSSVKTLRPGEGVRLRVRALLDVSSGKEKSDADYSVKVVPELRSETFIPNVENGVYGTDIANDYPRLLYGPELMLRIVKKSESKTEVRSNLFVGY